MLPCTKEVSTSQGVVKVYDLTLGFIAGIEDGTVVDNPQSIVLDGSDLTEETILKYRGSDIDVLSKEIMMLTYPAAFDENGELYELPDDPDTDKKKI